jgi:hypothetical protein
MSFSSWFMGENKLQKLAEDDRISSRKRVLFSCACYRHVWDKIDAKTKKTVEEIEKIKFQPRPEPVNTQNIMDDAFCNFYIIKMTKSFNDAILSINHNRENLMDVVAVAIYTARISGDSRTESIWQLKLWNHLVRS